MALIIPAVLSVGAEEVSACIDLRMMVFRMGLEERDKYLKINSRIASC